MKQKMNKQGVWSALDQLAFSKKVAKHLGALKSQGDRILIPCNDVDRQLESDLITGS